MWDWNIVLKIWLCLAIAAILGGIIGWLLKTLFGSKCQKCDEYEGTLRARNDEITKLKASVGNVSANANAENVKDDAEIASWKSKVSSLEADLKTCHERQSTMESELKTWSTKAATLSSAGSASAGSSEKDIEIARLKAEFGNLEAKLKVVRSDDAADESEIKRLRDENSKLTAKLGDAENENVYLLGQVKKAESGESIKRDVPMDQRDDLELINGVGPVLERMLYDMGIYFFKDVASWDAAKVAEMDEKLPRFRGRIEREGWVASAKEEHFKKYGTRL